MNCNCIYLHLMDAFVFLLAVHSTGKEQLTKMSYLTTDYSCGVSHSLTQRNKKIPQRHGIINDEFKMPVTSLFIK